MNSKDIWDIEDAICPECHSLINTNRIDIETGEKYLVCDQCGYVIKLELINQETD